MDTNKFKNIEHQTLQDLNLKRKPDGTKYRSRLDMKEAYKKSKLFYPFSAIWNLDYCWNIVKSYMKNSIFFAVPFTLVASYILNPKVRKDGMKRPFAYYVSVYMMTYCIISGYFLIDALAFCDYCKPWSYVYNEDNRKERYKEMLKTKIKSEQSSLDIINKKTKNQGLKDEEI